MQAPWIAVEEIGWSEATSPLSTWITSASRRCSSSTRWEWLLADEFGNNIRKTNMRIIEPAWKMTLASKGLLPILWELCPNHPLPLEASFQRHKVLGDYVMGLCRSRCCKGSRRRRRQRRNPKGRRQVDPRRRHLREDEITMNTSRFDSRTFSFEVPAHQPVTPIPMGLCSDVSDTARSSPSASLDRGRRMKPAWHRPGAPSTPPRSRHSNLTDRRLVIPHRYVASVCYRGKNRRSPKPTCAFSCTAFQRLRGGSGYFATNNANVEYHESGCSP